jgi:putative ABC transport system permease protein
MEARLPDFLVRHVAEDANEWTSFPIMKLKDIHLHSHLDNEQKANGSITTVYTFSAIAVFILLIGCINFMNLSTARSAQRSREVGMRKVLGAFRQQLVFQFLGESILLSLLAMVMAAAMVELTLPWFNSFMELDIAFDYLGRPGLMLSLLALTLSVGIVAGSYPAFYLSAFLPAKVLKGQMTRGGGGVLFRKILVIAQFAISIALVIATGVVYAQVKFAAAMDLGFDREQIVVLQGAPSTGFGDSYDAMKQQMLQHPGVISVSAANLIPGDQNTNADFIRAEGNGPEGRGMPFLNVDYDFFKTFGIRFLSGRTFSLDRGTDIFVEPTEDNPQATASYILNELAARQLGWTPDEALGKWVEMGGNEPMTLTTRGPVIGVVEDIYFSSLREEIKPVLYRVTSHTEPVRGRPNFRQMAIKLDARDIDETLAFIEETWSSYQPDVPITQDFLDDNFEALYASERTQGQLFTLFALLAIFIACLGLFGLASFTTEQRTKEIGIRKVMGGSIADIVILLSRDFGYLVLFANVLAWPVAWFLMERWLQNFAYRIDLGIFTFIISGLLALVIAMLTVGGLATRAAWSKPALALRYE